MLEWLKTLAGERSPLLNLWLNVGSVSGILFVVGAFQNKGPFEVLIAFTQWLRLPEGIGNAITGIVDWLNEEGSVLAVPIAGLIGLALGILAWSKITDTIPTAAAAGTFWVLTMIANQIGYTGVSWLWTLGTASAIIFFWGIHQYSGTNVGARYGWSALGSGAAIGVIQLAATVIILPVNILGAFFLAHDKPRA